MAKKGKVNGMEALEPLAIMAAGAAAGAVFGTSLNGMLSPELGYGAPKNGVIDMTTATNKELPMTQTPTGVFGIKAVLALALLYGASETTAETSNILAGAGLGLLGQGAAQFVVQKTNEGGTEPSMWTGQGKISGVQRYGRRAVGCGCSSKMEGVYLPNVHHYDQPTSPGQEQNSLTNSTAL